MTQEDWQTELCSAQYHVGNIRIDARLVAQPVGMGERYAITMAQEGESACFDLGENRDAARSIFLRVVYGGVTLCTLEEIIEDAWGTLF